MGIGEFPANAMDGGWRSGFHRLVNSYRIPPL